uniref:Uncharacterized protein n=1 Tax=Lepeophtheirus salmonis TaxID=72036 RepID=A0A0K2VE29_LEPSM
MYFTAYNNVDVVGSLDGDTNDLYSLIGDKCLL